MKMNLVEICRTIDWDERFWNPTKLFAKKDIRGQIPGIYCAVSNRTGGKSYGISQLFMKYNDLTDGKFGFIAKNQNDLGNIAEGIMGQLLRDKYPNWTLVEKVSDTKKFSRLFLQLPDPENAKEILEVKDLGYVLALNAAMKLKNYSSMFSDCDVLFLDEFQGDEYLKDEIKKLVLLMGSVSRGGPDGVRYVPLIMCSNSISIQNIYFEAWGVSHRIKSDTHFCRADGVVIERFTNEYSKQKQSELPINRAFANSGAVSCSVDNSWLNDSNTCIRANPGAWGRGFYMCTLVTKEGVKLGVRKFDEVGVYYVNRSFDDNCPNTYRLNLDDEGAPVVKMGLIFTKMKGAFYAGNLMFSDLGVKSIMLENVL